MSFKQYLVISKTPDICHDFKVNKLLSSVTNCLLVMKSFNFFAVSRSHLVIFEWKKEVCGARYNCTNMVKCWFWDVCGTLITSRDFTMFWKMSLV